MGEIIPFRRRKFENDATLAEIFRRCGLVPATAVRAVRVRAKRAPELVVVGAEPATMLARHESRGDYSCDVAVIWTATGQAVKNVLCNELSQNGLVVGDAMVGATAWRALIVLSEGTAATAVEFIEDALSAPGGVVVVQDHQDVRRPTKMPEPHASMSWCNLK